MEEIYVLDSSPWGRPHFNNHAELGELCISSTARGQYMDSRPSTQREITASARLREMAAGAVEMRRDLKPIAVHLFLACEIIGDKLPTGHPQLSNILRTVGESLDAQTTLQDLHTQATVLEGSVGASSRTLERWGIPSVNLTDIMTVKDSRASQTR